MLLGDANDFQEFAKGYYGVRSHLTSNDLKKIAHENDLTHKALVEERNRELAKINPIVVTISHPESPIVYYIVEQLLGGNLFGHANDISLRLFTDSKNTRDVDGLRMEIEDMASTKLRHIKLCQRAEEAFKGCDFAILFDELKIVNSGTNEQENNYNKPYIYLAKIIDEYAKP